MTKEENDEIYFCVIEKDTTCGHIDGWVYLYMGSESRGIVGTLYNFSVFELKRIVNIIKSN